MNRFKYPRTPHLPWSPGASSDDTRAHNLVHFQGKYIVVTEKMDGENTSLYPFGMHARSLDSRHHASRNWVKALQGQIAHLIPKGWRICGENVFARHSIAYSDLPSYFLAFSIWDDSNQCLSWESSIRWFEALGLSYPKVIYQGIYDEAALRAIELDLTTTEGYVVRLAEAFAYQAFSTSVAKWVRKNHVQTHTHWMHSAIVPNTLREADNEA